MDYKSSDLRKIDLFDGEKMDDQASYDAMRKEKMKERTDERPVVQLLMEEHNKATKDKRSAFLKEVKASDIHEYERIVKKHQLDRAGYDGAEKSGGAGFSAVKAKKSFIDSKGRRIDMVMTAQGGISIQFYFLDDDKLGPMYEAIHRRFHNNFIIPARYHREINIVSPLRSICVFLRPQEFELGFKTELMRKLEELVK